MVRTTTRLSSAIIPLAGENPTRTRCIPLISSHISARCVCVHVYVTFTGSQRGLSGQTAAGALGSLPLSPLPLTHSSPMGREHDGAKTNHPFCSTWSTLNAQWSGISHPGLVAARLNSDTYRSYVSTATTLTRYSSLDFLFILYYAKNTWFFLKIYLYQVGILNILS